MPTFFSNFLRTMRIGQARSESLLITTARSKLSSNASSRSWAARFTSEPFSSFSQISTVGLAGSVASVAYLLT